MIIYTYKNAKIDSTNTYRYTLERVWDINLPKIVFIGLNPSTANSELDDNTIRKCVKLSKNLGFGHLYMLNLFAFRATKPITMIRSNNPIGKENDFYLLSICKEVETVVLCYGNNGKFLNRDITFLEMLKENNIKAYAFDINKNKTPKHPLYLKDNSILKPYIY